MPRRERPKSSAFPAAGNADLFVLEYALTDYLAYGGMREDKLLDVLYAHLGLQHQGVVPVAARDLADRRGRGDPPVRRGPGPRRPGDLLHRRPACHHGQL